MLLAEVLGDADAGDGLFDGGVDVGQDAQPFARHVPRQPAKQVGKQVQDRHEGQQPESQAAADPDQDNQQHSHLQKLAEDVGEQDKDPCKLLGVRRDPADDPPGRQLAEEGHGLLSDRAEGVLPQLQHDVTGGLGHLPPADPVGGPAHEAEEEKGGGKSDQ